MPLNLKNKSPLVTHVSSGKNSKTKPSPTPDSDNQLPDTLNIFYGRFKQASAPFPSPSDPLPPPTLTIYEEEVRSTFRGLKRNKAADPDNISPSVLHHCAAELAGVFTNIFNTSLCKSSVPKCFKESIIIPIPKTKTISCLNDYRPIALTLAVMKSFERIILKHLKTVTTPLMDPHQFAYTANRSVEDTVNLAIHHILNHLESANTYAHILFMDFSSAFNTINPAKMCNKLLDMNINPCICHWIHSFLWNRQQRVKINNNISSPLFLSTGAPQGCVLLPWLFSLYTNQLTTHYRSVNMYKYADDTTIIGLITNNQETEYRAQINQAVTWCTDHDLLLNTSKTKELIVDLRRQPSPKTPVFIKGESISITDTYKLLGTHISNNLKWKTNADYIYKKAQQRLFHLRQLKKFRVRPHLLLRFYTAIVESILTSSITVWFSSLDTLSRKKLQRIINRASKIIGSPLPSLELLHHKRTLCRARKITSDPTHPAHYAFQLLPSRRRYRTIASKTTRFKNSFIPTAINILNSER